MKSDDLVNADPGWYTQDLIEPQMNTVYHNSEHLYSLPLTNHRYCVFRLQIQDGSHRDANHGDNIDYYDGSYNNATHAYRGFHAWHVDKSSPVDIQRATSLQLSLDVAEIEVPSAKNVWVDPSDDGSIPAFFNQRGRHRYVGKQMYDGNARRRQATKRKQWQTNCLTRKIVAHTHTYARRRTGTPKHSHTHIHPHDLTRSGV